MLLRNHRTYERFSADLRQITSRRPSLNRIRELTGEFEGGGDFEPEEKGKTKVYDEDFDPFQGEDPYRLWEGDESDEQPDELSEEDEPDYEEDIEKPFAIKTQPKTPSTRYKFVQTEQRPVGQENKRLQREL